MSRDPDRQVFAAAGGLGLGVFALAFVLVPVIFPAIIVYRVALALGAMNLHPAIMIVVAGAAGWAFWKLGGILIRSVRPVVARRAIAAYIGVCYAFVFFQRELTTAQSELDVTWLLFTFAIFAIVGWKVGGALVQKAHRDGFARAQPTE